MMITYIKPTTTFHFEKFEKLLEGNKRSLAASAKEFGTKEEIAKYFEIDPNLNSIPRDLFFKHSLLDSKEYSTAQNFALIKHYLIFHYLKAKPEFVDKQHLHQT